MTAFMRRLTSMVRCHVCGNARVETFSMGQICCNEYMLPMKKYNRTFNTVGTKVFIEDAGPGIIVDVNDNGNCVVCINAEEFFFGEVEECFNLGDADCTAREKALASFAKLNKFWQ